MAKGSPYIVLARDLPVRRTFEVPASRVSDWVKGVPMREALDAPDPDPNAGSGQATFDLYADGSHVFVNGALSGFITVACSRCVGPVRLPIEESLHVTFMPPDELPSDHTDGDEDGDEVTAEDIDVFPFDGDHIDLEPMLREQFILAIPFAPLCRDDCRGLCPQCGADRNTSPCQCEAPVDPRLEGLRNLKLPS